MTKQLLELTNRFLSIRRSQRKTLVTLTVGLISAGKIGVAAIGRGIEGSALEKHKIKRVDRFLGNEKLNGAQVAKDLFKEVTAPYNFVFMSIDWTDCHDGVHQTLRAALITNSRALPIWSKTVRKDELTLNQNMIEDKFVEEIKELFASEKKIIILADRGFHRVGFLRKLEELRFEYIVRLPINVWLEHPHFRGVLGGLIVKWGILRDFRCGKLQKEEKYPVRVVAYFEKGQKEPWLLATNIRSWRPKKVIQGYGRRFEVEESIRDAKSWRFGFAMKGLKLSTPERWDRMFLVVSFAYIIMVLAGIWGEKKKIHRKLMANTSKRRTLALWRVGRYVLLKMKELKVTWERFFSFIPELLWTG